MSAAGIFWVYKGRLIHAAVRLAQGIDDGDFINGPCDHATYWDTVRCTHPDLRFYEYYEIPRGRVLFKKAEGRFYVYMDKVLHPDHMKRMLRQAFALPRGTRFLTDVHYTTTLEDLERLFEDP